MFSLFKNQMHEPVKKQHEDLRREPIGPLAIAGIDCDEIPGGRGPFGLSHNNPIPVNGLIGTHKYLNKLRSPSGVIYYFHRLGSVNSDITSDPVDVYEMVDINGQNWEIVFLDMYHPRRSNKIPPGLLHKPYDKTLGDLPFAYGVDIYCKDFPYDLPTAIENRNKLPAFSRRVHERVAKGGFDAPEVHALKVQGVQMRLISMRG